MFQTLDRRRGKNSEWTSCYLLALSESSKPRRCMRYDPRSTNSPPVHASAFDGSHPLGL
jgi:hypothetical protein